MRLAKPIKVGQFPPPTQSRDQRPQLTAEEIPKLPEWNQVVVNHIKDATTSTGKQYWLVSYYSTTVSWRHMQAYFNDADLSPIARAVGLSELVDTDQLVGQELFVSFGVKAGRGSNAGKEFVNCTGYQAINDGEPRVNTSDVPF